jgi:molybdopterin/thiamine biosynthesis adenylyltransferase
MKFARYERQMRFANIGEKGQERICNARVLIIGVGALGSVVAELLARSGVRFLRLIDRDFVERTNLQRQALYTEDDALQSLAKVQAASNHLARINSEVTVEGIAIDVVPSNMLKLAESIDVIVDGTDNFETRFLINDLAWEIGVPWIHGGCVGTTGQAFAFRPGKTICFRCLVPTFPDPASIATCDTAGVLAPATHLIAAIQAMETLKLLAAGDELPVEEGLISMEMWNRKFRLLSTEGLLGKNCPCCHFGQRDFLFGAGARAEPLVLCGRNAVQLPAPASGISMELNAIADRWRGLGLVHSSKYLVRMELGEGVSIALFRDGRAVIGGTENPVVAKQVYARYVGG